ncbi:MAG TPA: prepilin-type N-terminal cleavage/methylation domain-containing protein [Gemmatimonadales bacterium]
MHSASVTSRTGLTLLEVMVALVVLGIVGTAFLETFAGALRSSTHARAWGQALVYAEEGQESLKIAGEAPAGSARLPLGGGFSRQITIRNWREGVDEATVTVTLPDGARFELHRLVPTP